MAKSLAAHLPPPEGKVFANPTKNFFVTMLTRDIVLTDAIMDLVDNCIDGVHRQTKGLNKKQALYRYKGFKAEIVLNSKEFRLTDNCGGIPFKVAKEYAFRMGRSEDYHDDDKLETLGMYGIGMKRAIFKMGNKAEVSSWNNNDIFRVKVPENWSQQPDWYFDIAKLKKSSIRTLLKQPGTCVHITALYPGIAKQFGDQSGFIKDLIISLRNHYGYIIQQGFTIAINGIKVKGFELNILTTDDTRKVTNAIKPYVYASSIDDIEIEIFIGFYRPPPSQKELDIELNGDLAASLSDNAGITVICNDRVVLSADKSLLTGWGDSPVPKYHTQFIAIAGVVHFRSKNPISLPVTTTKRGLDTSSPVYLTSKNRIKQGLKLFTNFTNHWKTPTEERTALFKKTTTINALQPGQSNSNLIKLVNSRSDSHSKLQIPDLPKPNTIENSKLVKISFDRDRTQVEKISNFYHNGKMNSPASIGGWCFDIMYKQIES